MASNIGQESNLAMHLQLASMAWAEAWRTPPAEPQGTTDTGRLYSSEEQKDVKWPKLKPRILILAQL